ncbi:MAG: hypothetical protein A3G33_03030 [Omnitrophica bacterium RIFCSPLOWO2_12_FULL_44_17]|uniref:Pyridoxamine 5'-phosphate oxidase N-terminal domain-containing protein n=1 Tax=Candidatus Danuiimicrobium aquiferis TaxID=1801832 RepID=A0A1G1KVJ5_9BACT|nr:MAG: hypothetical protein A3B72_04510 [Omnitrophica bacterium RIFCSPHIGHO2_02_FULL_45_28]OGW96953.1 MAG: hypothetical protein A3G33_03030 [Omnitrophica bacterium RIFCSPLOWO2_12_FULL_44_17]OGX03912.1 MAG: hypothetical protein A3J12_03385 [Omnitrophica bacterium RIFCSPLOWO2_02_FULL_44_11]
MSVISEKAMHFLEKQGVVVVSTLDEFGKIHCSVKGIVGLEKEGKVFVIDLYHHRTFQNLQKNPTVSITAIDEHAFAGYTLQGKAKIVPREEIQGHIIEKWEKRIVRRISNRLIKSLQAGVLTERHHEAHLPTVPKYLIEVDVEKVIDLTPPVRKSPDN